MVGEFDDVVDHQIINEDLVFVCKFRTGGGATAAAAVLVKVGGDDFENVVVDVDVCGGKRKCS